jgi:hypothetical protein
MTPLIYGSHVIEAAGNFEEMVSKVTETKTQVVFLICVRLRSDDSDSRVRF